jgi:hypothetical protein
VDFSCRQVGIGQSNPYLGVMNAPRTYWTICHLCGRESGDTNGKYDGTRWCGCPDAYDENGDRISDDDDEE